MKTISAASFISRRPAQIAIAQPFRRFPEGGDEGAIAIIEIRGEPSGSRGTPTAFPEVSHTGRSASMARLTTAK
jgi:hypothetical protein